MRGAISRVPGLVRHGVEIDAHRGAFTLARVEQAAGPVAVADVVVRRTRVPGQARGVAADGHAVRVDQVALEGFAERADAEDAGEGGVSKEEKPSSDPPSVKKKKSSGKRFLSATTRAKCALDIARGMAYLHSRYVFQ